MVARVSRDWSWAASGSERRFVFVRLSYTCKALLKINWWLADEEATGWAGGDMGAC